MSEAYRQTISDELAAAIDARRGLLSRQEFTTLALVAMLEQPTIVELVQQVAQLRAELQQRVPAAPSVAPSAELLTF